MFCVYNRRSRFSAFLALFNEKTVTTFNQLKEMEMGKLSVKTDKRQAGFTLVELAVVMIIIGLLIGGILKGQELIANAQITGTASSIKGIDAATTTFRDTYAAMPGDITNPGTRLPNCLAGTTCNTAGDGNSRVEPALNTNGIAAAPATEMTTFFAHLSAADLVTGIDADATNPNVFGGRYPSAPIAGGFHAAYDNSGALGSNAASRPGHYLALHNVPGGAPNGSALSATQAARLDRKLDDGVANTGTVFDDGGCDTAADGVYDESVGTAVCDLFIRFQN